MGNINAFGPSLQSNIGTLIGYGGEEEILNVLDNNIQHIAYHVNDKYFVAKNQILSSNSIDDILKIDPYSEIVDEEIV